MNKVSTVIIFIILILIPVSVVLSQMPESKPLGSFTELSGAVKYDKGGSSGYADLAKDDALKLSLFPKDMISTTEATTGEIIMSCGARLEIVQNSEFQMGYNSIKINKGGTWINYKPVSDNKGEIKFKVETPVGTIGIRGTKFAVLVSPEEKNVMVQVMEGVVSMDSDKGSAVINGGELLTVEDGKAIGKPFKTDPDVDILKADKKPEKDGKKKKIVEEAPKMIENNSNTNPWNGLKNQ